MWTLAVVVPIYVIQKKGIQSDNIGKLKLNTAKFSLTNPKHNLV